MIVHRIPVRTMERVLIGLESLNVPVRQDTQVCSLDYHDYEIYDVCSISITSFFTSDNFVLLDHIQCALAWPTFCTPMASHRGPLHGVSLRPP